MTTEAEKAHLDAVSQLGCIACRNRGFGASPAACHHIRTGYGGAQKASDFEVLPLCGIHHQYGDGTPNYKGQYGYHHSPAQFEKQHGTEIKLLEQTYREVGRKDLIPIYIK